MTKHTFKKYVREHDIDDKSKEFFRKKFLNNIRIKKEDLNYVINLYLKTKNVTNFLKIVKKMGSNFSKENFKNYLEFRKENKYDSGSKKFFKIIYGKDWEKKYNEWHKKQSESHSLKSYIKKYGKEEGPKKWNEWRKKKSEIHSLEYYIKKYGEEKGPKKWDEWHKKISKANSLEGYIKKYGEEEGPKKWNEFIKKQSFNNSLEGYIKKYGEEDGPKKWNEFIKKHSLEGYIKKYGEEDGPKKWNEFIKKQSFNNSLEGYIKKYGEEKGPKKWKEFIKKQSFNNSLEGYIKKYGEEEGPKKWKNNMDKFTYKSSTVSKASIRFFDKLNTFLEDDLIYGKGKELHLSDGEKSYFYDATYQNKYVIEFHGDIFHGNPEKFGPDDHCFPYDKTITAKQLWEYDAKKKKVAEDNGYIYICFWENEKPENAYKKLLEMGIK